MSFQEDSETLQSRLHLGKLSPSALIAFLVVMAVVLTSCVYGVVQLVSSRTLAVEKAGDDESFGAAVGGEGLAGDDDQFAVSTMAEEVVVHVSGSVVAPGVYSLPAGSRVSDAVLLAGGATEEANLDSLNLARVLNDAEQVYVPGKQEASASVAPSPSSEATSASLRVNINTAGIDELMTLDGVGEATAKKIVSDREKNGPFGAVEDLKRVPGIGEKKFKALKEYICV